jgi:hypothetical protein
MSKKLTHSATDSVTDLIEKISSPASRAGSAINRVGKMLEAGVTPTVIALQMTVNSPKGKQYTVAKVLAYGDLYEDAKTKAPITSAQSRALIEDQRAQLQSCDKSATAFA